MKLLPITVLVYGLLVLIGGIMGHYKAASQASLISGLIFGALLLTCAFFLFKEKNRFAAYSALFLTFILDGFFTYRFSLSLKFFPSGMMSLASLLTLILLAYQIRKANLYIK